MAKSNRLAIKAEKFPPQVVEFWAGVVTTLSLPLPSALGILLFFQSAKGRLIFYLQAHIKPASRVWCELMMRTAAGWGSRLPDLLLKLEYLPLMWNEERAAHLWSIRDMHQTQDHRPGPCEDIFPFLGWYRAFRVYRLPLLPFLLQLLICVLPVTPSCCFRSTDCVCSLHSIPVEFSELRLGSCQWGLGVSC